VFYVLLPLLLLQLPMHCKASTPRFYLQPIPLLRLHHPPENNLGQPNNQHIKVLNAKKITTMFSN
jgi:hypothetical protein